MISEFNRGIAFKHK